MQDARDTMNQLGSLRPTRKLSKNQSNNLTSKYQQRNLKKSHARKQKKSWSRKRKPKKQLLHGLPLNSAVKTRMITRSFRTYHLAFAPATDGASPSAACRLTNSGCTTASVMQASKQSKISLALTSTAWSANIANKTYQSKPRATRLQLLS